MHLFILVIILLILIIWHCIKNWYVNRNGAQEEVPFGYKGIPGIGLLPYFKVPKCRQRLVDIREKYGPICKVRMGSFDCVWLNDYKLIKAAWSNPIFCGRPFLPGISLRSKGFRGGIIFNDGPEFTEQRRFVISSLKSFGLGKKPAEQYVLEEVQDLLKTLEATENCAISTRHLFNIPAFNIIWKLVTGGVGFKHDDPTMSKLVSTLNRNMELKDGVCAAFWMPWLARYFPRLTGWNEYVQDANNIYEFWQKFAENAVKDNLEDNGLLREYQDKILQCTNTSSSFHCSKGVMSLGTVLQDLFIAGSETTATTLQWICLYLAAFPNCQNKIFKEISSILKKTEESINLDLRSCLPYTEAFIQESLRYSTLAPLGMVHCTMEDITFENYFIRKGTLVQMNVCAVHFDKSLWENAEDFQPERFLTGEGKLRQGEIPGFIPFSWGKRMCPGAELARQTLFLATVSICNRFQILYENGGGETRVDLRAKVGVSAVPYPHKLVFKARE